MNLEYFTSLLIKYHIAFYYLALLLNLTFFRRGTSIAFLSFIGFFWFASFGVGLALGLDKLL